MDIPRSAIEAIFNDIGILPPNDGRWCCLSCQQWTPHNHPEAHEHLHDCPAVKEYAIRRNTRERMRKLLDETKDKTNYNGRNGNGYQPVSTGIVGSPPGSRVSEATEVIPHPDYPGTWPEWVLTVAHDEYMRGLQLGRSVTHPNEPAAFQLTGFGQNATDFNSCHERAIDALRYVATHGRTAEGGSQFPNDECCMDIAHDLDMSFKAIRRLYEEFMRRAPDGCGACSDACANRKGCQLAEASPEKPACWGMWDSHNNWKPAVGDAVPSIDEQWKQNEANGYRNITASCSALEDAKIAAALDERMGLDNTLGQMIRGDTLAVGYSKVDVVRALLRALKSKGLR